MRDLARSVYNLEGEVMSEVDLPEVFRTEIRPDLIRRVYLSQLTARIQPQGRHRRAGLKTSAESWGVGRGVARVPRFKGRNYPAAARAARAPFVRGGRSTHPPKAEKVVWERVNKKERRLAIRSSIAASASIELVSSKHRMAEEKQVPIIVVGDLEQIDRTNRLYDVLLGLGLREELMRVKRRFRKIRSGKGKMRGRKRVRAKGPLIVYGESSKVFLAARNISGVGAVSIRELSVIHLAPGGVPGRLTIWSEAALKAAGERFSR